MENILVFGAGKSTTVLIRKLLEECAIHGWRITVVDQDLALAESKISGSASGSAIAFSVTDEERRREAIASANLVISLLPPSLHILVARDCLLLRKNLFTASYADPELLALDADVRLDGLLFLCEMGLDPGIDHMSASSLVQDLQEKGAVIKKFRSHCGGLVASSSDDNPWHYKISWNPANVVNAGSAGAVYIEDGEVKSLTQAELFAQPFEIDFPGYDRWMVYPNRDSLQYASLYRLDAVDTFVRTTIRHAAFMNAWSAVLNAGLPDLDASGVRFSEWSVALKPFVNSSNSAALEYLGFWSDEPIPEPLRSGRSVLQYLLESRLMMRSNDRDLVLMLHEIEYELDNQRFLLQSSLALEGVNSVDTAMARTVGLPLAHAAVCFLEGKIRLTGIVRPIVPEIYRLVLPRLAAEGIVFKENTTEL